MKTYMVRGCGITAICKEGPNMLWILMRIVEKGGVPSVTFLTEEGGLFQ